MKIKILFFAHAREIFGETARVVELPEGSSIEAAVEKLGGGPALKEIPLIFAVNENFEPAEKILSPNDHLAIMMPTAGG